MSLRKLLVPVAGRGVGQSHTARRFIQSGAANAAVTVDGASLSHASENVATEKSMDELDGPVGWPLVGNFLSYLKKKNRGRMHQVQEELHKKYGKIFREKWGPNWQCHVSDPDLIEQVSRKEGRYPNRPPIGSWRLYREVRQRSMGLVTANGSDWQKFRSELNKKMLCPKSARELVPPFTEVSDTLITKLRHIRETKGDRALTREIQNELYKWGMESGGTFLFEKRLGCLDINIAPRAQQFINAIMAMQESSLPVIVGERLHWKLNTRFWRRHQEAWDNIFKIGQTYIDERLRILEDRLKGGEEEFHSHKGEILTYLLSRGNLSMDEIYSNITEIFLGSIDTTANSVGFALHLLANNPEVQEKAHNEVSSVLEGRTKVTASDIDNLPYVKAVIKEAQRLYPVATMNCRILEDDIILGGYRIPKNTLFVLNHYTAGRDESVFVEPTRFLPERWLRDGSRTHHPFASLPFGFGVRSCIGQRVAKLEMCVLISKMLQEFHIRRDESEEFSPTLRTLLTPGDCLPVYFENR